MRYVVVAPSAHVGQRGSVDCLQALVELLEPVRIHHSPETVLLGEPLVEVNEKPIEDELLRDALVRSEVCEDQVVVPAALITVGDEQTKHRHELGLRIVQQHILELEQRVVR